MSFWTQPQSFQLIVSQCALVIFLTAQIVGVMEIFKVGASSGQWNPPTERSPVSRWLTKRRGSFGQPLTWSLPWPCTTAKPRAWHNAIWNDLLDPTCAQKSFCLYAQYFIHSCQLLWKCYIFYLLISISGLDAMKKTTEDVCWIREIGIHLNHVFSLCTWKYSWIRMKFICQESANLFSRWQP